MWKNEALNTLIQNMIDASQGCVAYCQASYDGHLSSATFTFRIVSDSFAQWLGLATDAIVGRKLQEVDSEIDSELLVRCCEESFNLKKLSAFDLTHSEPNNEVQKFRLMAQPQGEGVILSLMFVDNLKYTEPVIYTPTEFSHVLHHVSLYGVVLLQAIRDDLNNVVDFLIIAANRAVERILLRSHDSIVGKTLLTEFPGATESGFFDLYLSVMKSGDAQGTEHHYQDENGLTGWFDVIASPQLADQIVLVFRNTTAQHDASLWNQRQVKLLQKILDSNQTTLSVHEPVYDKQKMIVGFRATLYGQHAEHDLVQAWEDMLTPVVEHQEKAVAYTEDTFARCVRVMEIGTADAFDYKYQNRTYAVNVTSADKYLVLSTVDVTDEREQVKQLEVTNRHLAQSNEDLQSFAFVASHDLQEPLRKIRQFGDLLIAQYSEKIGPEGTDILLRMHKAANRMSILVQDILSLSRISTQPQSMHQVNMRQLIIDVLEDLDIVVQEKQASIQIGELSPVWGDERQLRQLLQNLLTNALKFTKPGQKPVVVVDCRLVGPPQLPQKLKGHGPCNCIKVADNGIGFDAKAYGNRIFETFQRLHSRREYAGTGIGLAVVRKVIERHGGEVLVESEPEKGAIFYIFLPTQQTQ